jgi:hypothetical protein
MAVLPIKFLPERSDENIGLKSNNPKGRVPRVYPWVNVGDGDMRCRINAWKFGYPGIQHIGQNTI